MPSNGPPILTWEQLAAAPDVPRTARGLLDSILTTLRPPSSEEPPAAERQRWFLAELNVEGFVGIVSPVTIALPPKPGITVVTAQNGAGKSSLALALRHLLGGAAINDEIDPNLRVRWQNIRLPTFRLMATFVDAPTGHHASLADDGDGAGPRFAYAGEDQRALPQEWAAAKSRFEPVVIYPEIAAAMGNEGKVNDAWFKALSLDVLNSVHDEAVVRRKASEGSRDGLNKTFRELADLELDDDIRAMLPDKIESLSTESVRRAWKVLEERRAELRDARAYCPPLSANLEDHLAQFYEASERLVHRRDGDDARGEILRSLFREALQLHIGVDDRCPLCGSSDRKWRVNATRQLAELDDRYIGSGIDRFDSALENLQRALPTYPGGADTRLPGTLAEQIRTLEATWDSIREALRELRSSDLDLRAVQRLRTKVRNAVLEHRALEHDMREYLDLDPQEIGRQKLNEFFIAWEQSCSSVTEYENANNLLKWLRSQRQYARDVLTSELSDKACTIFRQLCPEGHLELAEYVTTGGTEQRQKMSASVKLSDSDADGGTEVLSTGQLNALCLSAFLPRTMRPVNPFGFVVLDDPIQAFDSERIHHLAEVLRSAGETFQVVVLTHDERLCNTLRSSGTTFVHYTLRNDSGYPTAERLDTPASHLVKDAELIANENLPDPASEAALAIATLAICRQAVDDALSACNDVLNYVKKEPSTKLKGKTTKQRLENMNARLRNDQRQEIPRDNDLFKLMNDAAHGNPPPDSDRNSRTGLTKRTKKLIGAIEHIASKLR